VQAHPTTGELKREVDALVDACRETALWSLRRDWYPHTDDERRSVLRDIQKHGDAALFRRAARLLEWLSRRSSDASASYRFFPLVEHETFGLTLHPLDLATNKLLAVIGRREPRDFVDIVRCHEAVQPLGYLAWAASGKDPGFSPARIVEECARTRYAQAELDPLDFDGPAPRLAELSAAWHDAIASAREIVAALPAEEVGSCVIDARGGLERATAAELPEQLRAGAVAFHAGRIRGAFPEVRPAPSS
jgi:hypothetical protein